MKAKIVSIVLSILGYAILLGETLMGNLAADTAAVVAALIAVGYIASRTLAKIAGGTDPKSIFKSTEFWNTALVSLAALGLAIAGKMGVAQTSGIIVALTVLQKFGKSLVDTKAPPALPVDVPRSKDGGFIDPKTWVFVGFVAALLALGMALHSTKKAKAEEVTPQLGTCITRTICIQPAVALSALQLNLKTLTYTQVAFSAGYGVTWQTKTVNLGAAVYGGVGLSKSSPNAPQASLMFNVGDTFAFGPGVQTFKTSDGDRIWQGLFSVALNYNLGGSPHYLKEAVKAERLRLAAGGVR